MHRLVVKVHLRRRKCFINFPQGCVLGPLLFLIFINDLPHASSKLTFYLFADDTNVYCESGDLTVLEKTVNKELKQIEHWLDINKLR